MNIKNKKVIENSYKNTDKDRSPDENPHRPLTGVGNPAPVNQGEKIEHFVYQK